MGHRVISGLSFAAPCARPAGIPVGRPRGTKRLGIKYEKDFANALGARFPGAVTPGQWFHFVDINGSGYCQTDILLRLRGEIFLFECKLTDTERARSQLSRLYIPVVERCFALPARGITVTRHLSGETQPASVVDQLEVALKMAWEGIPTLHWRERNPL